jgi:hypothetical protein
MGIFWYIFAGFLIYYLYMYFMGKFDPQSWNTIYVLLTIGLVGWFVF